MFKRHLVVCLVVLAVNLSLGAVASAAQSLDPIQAARVEKMRKQVNKKGTGKKVVVAIVDGTKVEGRISEIKQDTFVLTNYKTGAPVEVKYVNARAVRRDIPLAAKVAILVGTIGGMLLILGYLTRGA